MAALTASQVGYLSPGQLQALGKSAALLAAGTLAALSGSDIAAIYPSLSAAQLASLSTSQAASETLAASQTSALISSLSSAGLLSEVKAAVAAGQPVFSYAGLLQILTGLEGAIGASGLTAAQFNDLEKLSAAVTKVEGSGSYLGSVLNSLVNGDPANATWTAGGSTSAALGNLAVGSSAAKFQELVGKWLLGGDLPYWGGPVTWSADTAPLFSSTGVAAGDPSQGSIGDCYLIAAAVEVAKDQPGLLESMFTDNGNGSFGVRFYSPSDKPVYVTVNDVLPSGNEATDVSGANWLSLMEKAFVAYDVEENGAANSYDTISGGWSNGLTAITGEATQSFLCCYTPSHNAWDTTVQSTVISALASGKDVLYGSFMDTLDPGNGRSDLISDHMFAVTGYDAATRDFILRNPWGAAGGSDWNGSFEASIDTLWAASGSASSSGFIVATGSAPSGSVIAPYAVHA